MDQPLRIQSIRPRAKADDEPHRSTEQVFKDHLALRLEGEVEKDIQRNYSADVVSITNHGIFHGHDGIRECSRVLREALPDAEFTYTRQIVCGEIAFLEWTGKGSGGRIVDEGVDTFLIRDGRIVAKTVHYVVDGS
jgi:hypothetical protein